MTKEEIEKDVAAAKSQREQLIANVNAVAGVIQYLEAKLAALAAKFDGDHDPA